MGTMKRVKQGARRKAGKVRRSVEAQRGKLRQGQHVKVSREVVEEGVYVEVKGPGLLRPSRVGGDVTVCKFQMKQRRIRRQARRLLGYVEKRGVGKRVESPVQYWEEERARVGTGYRVRYGEKGLGAGVKTAREGTQERREFDLGYAHKKYYGRPKTIEVERRKGGRKLRRQGKNARIRVRKEVCGLERRRPRSVYTGCGRTRKSRVGKKKLKPTKVRV